MFDPLISISLLAIMLPFGTESITVLYRQPTFRLKWSNISTSRTPLCGRLFPLNIMIIVFTIWLSVIAPEALNIQLAWISWRTFQIHRRNEVTVAYISCLRKIFPSHILHWMHGCFLNIMMHFPLAGKQWSGAQILRKCSLLFMKWRFPIKFPIETFRVSPHKTSSAEKDAILFFSWKGLY